MTPARSNSWPSAYADEREEGARDEDGHDHAGDRPERRARVVGQAARREEHRRSARQRMEHATDEIRQPRTDQHDPDDDAAERHADEPDRERRSSSRRAGTRSRPAAARIDTTSGIARRTPGIPGVCRRWTPSGVTTTRRSATTAAPTPTTGISEEQHERRPDRRHDRRREPRRLVERDLRDQRAGQERTARSPRPRR